MYICLCVHRGWGQGGVYVCILHVSVRMIKCIYMCLCEGEGGKGVVCVCTDMCECVCVCA